MKHYFTLLFVTIPLLCTQLKAQTTITPSTVTSATMDEAAYGFIMCGTTGFGDNDETKTYQYTATADLPCSSINLTNITNDFTGIFIFEDALPTASSDPCISSATNAFSTSDLLANFNMISGKTYYFVVTNFGESGTLGFDIELSLPAGLSTPNILMNASTNSSTLNIADGTTTYFYDSGGPSCEYAQGENYTLTVCPDAAGVAADKVVQVDLTTFNRDQTCPDTEMIFYKGATATPGNEIFMGEYSNEIHTEDVRKFSAIIAGGCMTITWVSAVGANCEGEGWEGNFQLIDNPCTTSLMADECIDAPLLKVGETLSSTTECFTPSIGASACGVGFNNDAWYKFVADGTTIEIDYEITGGNRCYASDLTSGDENSTTSGFQMLMYDGCTAADQICTSAFLASGGINVETGAVGSGTWSYGSGFGETVVPGQTYYVVFDGYGSDLCNFTVTGGTGIALPLEMAAFSAKENGKANQLSWTTLSEENTDTHVIERAGTDKNFQKIGTVDAAGISMESRSYEFFDETPLPVSHYRIRTVDIDGSISLSHVVTVTRKDKGLNLISINPNPTKGFFTMEVSAERAKAAELNIISITGKQMMVRNIELESGNQEVELNINDFPQGVYIVQLSTPTSTSSYKIIKN